METLILKYKWSVVLGYLRGAMICKIGITIAVVPFVILCSWAILAILVSPANETLHFFDTITPSFFLVMLLGVMTLLCGWKLKSTFKNYCEFSWIGPGKDCHIVCAKSKYRFDKWWWGSTTLTGFWAETYTPDARI